MKNLGLLAVLFVLGCGPEPMDDLQTEDAASLAAAAVVPVDISKYEMLVLGSGFESPATFDSTCATADEHYTLDMATRTMTWRRCAKVGSRFQLRTGSRVLVSAHFQEVQKRFNQLRLSRLTACHPNFPNPKPFITFTVSSPSKGTKAYADQVLACKGHPYLYVENIVVLKSVTQEVSGAFLPVP